MRFIIPYENKQPKILLIHDAFQDANFLEPLATSLRKQYMSIVVELDGHGKGYNHDYYTIEQQADGILQYIDLDTHRLAGIYGLGLGAQVAMMVLQKRPLLATHAVLENGLYQGSPSSAKQKASFLQRIGNQYEKAMLQNIARKTSFPSEDWKNLKEASKAVNGINRKRLLKSIYGFAADQKSLQSSLVQWLFLTSKEETLYEASAEFAATNTAKSIVLRKKSTTIGRNYYPQEVARIIVAHLQNKSPLA